MTMPLPMTLPHWIRANVTTGPPPASGRATSTYEPDQRTGVTLRLAQARELLALYIACPIVDRLPDAITARWYGIRYERCTRCLIDPYHA